MVSHSIKFTLRPSYSNCSSHALQRTHLISSHLISSHLRPRCCSSSRSPSAHDGSVCDTRTKSRLAQAEDTSNVNRKRGGNKRARKTYIRVNFIVVLHTQLVENTKISVVREKKKTDFLCVTHIPWCVFKIDATVVEEKAKTKRIDSKYPTERLN